MTLIDLKQREKGLLNSHNSRFIEYGKACRDIMTMCKEFAGPKLSEQVLITEMAEKYAEKEKELFDLTKNEKHRLHIKLASEYYLKEFMSFDKLYDILSPYNKIFSFEEAKVILQEDMITFDRIKSKTLMDVLKFIELNIRGTV